MKHFGLLLIVLASLTPGCSTPASSAPAPQPASLGSTEKVQRVGGVYLASQPSPDDFAKVREAGVRTVINLRAPGEQAGFDEAARAKELGLTYHNPVIGGADGMTDERLDEVRKLLRESGKPVLLHCASSNRVGAVWMVHRVLDQGASPEAAAAEAETVGLKSPALKEKALDYIRRHRSAR